jgi:hypothetical protein
MKQVGPVRHKLNRDLGSAFPRDRHACERRAGRLGMGSEAREVTDAEGITWTCIQAFAGLGNAPEKREAARVAGSDDVQVVCTPSGAARSRRLVLPAHWSRMTDDELLAAIAQGAES